MDRVFDWNKSDAVLTVEVLLVDGSIIRMGKIIEAEALVLGEDRDKDLS